MIKHSNPNNPPPTRPRPPPRSLPRPHHLGSGRILQQPSQPLGFVSFHPSACSLLAHLIYPLPTFFPSCPSYPLPSPPSLYPLPCLLICLLLLYSPPLLIPRPPSPLPSFQKLTTPSPLKTVHQPNAPPPSPSSSTPSSPPAAPARPPSRR